MIFMFVNLDATYIFGYLYIYTYIYIYIYNKQIFEWIVAKYMIRIKDIYIMQPIFLIYELTTSIVQAVEWSSFQHQGILVY